MPFFSDHEREQFHAAIKAYTQGTQPVDYVLNCLGPSRKPETAILAREELKRILERREDIEDVLGLDSGPLWTLEEEKTFEYGLFLYDGSTPDRFGMISQIMCGSRTREEVKRRYMKLVLDLCQIEMGSKNLTVCYQHSITPPAAAAAAIVPLPSPTNRVWMM